MTLQKYSARAIVKLAGDIDIYLTNKADAELAAKDEAIAELVNMLEVMHEAFSEDMFQEPLRELEALIAKHKGE